MADTSRPTGTASGIEVRLDHVLASAPSGLPLPVACWLVARVGYASVSVASAISPAAIVVRADGGVRIDADVVAPFAYRAPEMLRGGKPGERATVFGLGAILVECLTGRPAFLRDSDMETRIAVSQESVPTLIGRVAQATRALDEIVAKALEKDPSARYAAGLELAATLDDFLEAELLEVDPEDVVAAIEAGVKGESPRAAIEKGIAGAPRAADASAARPAPARRKPAPKAAAPKPAAPKAAAPKPAAPESASRPQAPAPHASKHRAGRSAATSSEAKPPEARRPRATPAAQAAPKSEAAPSSEATPGREPAPSPVEDRASDPGFAGRELDLMPEDRRLSAPDKPRLAPEVVHLGSPAQESGPGGITDAVVTGSRGRRANRISSGGLELDERALVAQRERPVTVHGDEEEEEPPPNWVARIAVALFALLGLAIVYQFVIRRFLLAE